MIRYLVIALVVLLVLWLFFWPAGRARFRDVPIRDLRRHLEFLLGIAKPGSFLIFKDRNSLRSVQFRKDVDERGAGFLALDFPDAPWSRCYFEGVARVLKTHSVHFDLVPTEFPECRRFLVVENIESAEEAQKIAELIFRELGFEGNDKVDVTLKVTGYEPVRRRKPQ